MKVSIYKLFTGACMLLGVLLTGCNKYLDVKPEDKILEKEVFSSETSINASLNGIYMGVAGNNLYGARLSTTAIEVLGQRYNFTSSNTWYMHSQYNYTEATVISSFENIWMQAYSQVLSINNFIGQLQKTEGVIIDSKKNTLLGEAYGLRAFLHFDLLRLFGPIYNTADSASVAIPYYTKADATLSAIIPARQVMDSVLTDLARAEQLLAADPIITSGAMNSLLNDGNDFYRYRNWRFNYYAAKALQARVLLYRNDQAGALAAAKAVIEAPLVNGAAPFPWLAYSKIVSEKQNPDRVFSPEVIFGIQNNAMYTNHNLYFDGGLGEYAILAPNTTRLSAVFEANENDYRYPTTWMVPTEGGGKTFRTFFKYADVITKSTSFRYFQPLIRLSEMYYIAAEASTATPAVAIGYINKVRANRGLADLATTVDVNTELKKEYQKEFYGEGQLFFYYKRKGTTAIPNGSATSGNVTMTTAKYVVPIPTAETSLR